jgi:hypothetical protein
MSRILGENEREESKPSKEEEEVWGDVWRSKPLWLSGSDL